MNSQQTPGRHFCFHCCGSKPTGGKASDQSVLVWKAPQAATRNVPSLCPRPSRRFSCAEIHPKLKQDGQSASPRLCPASPTLGHPHCHWASSWSWGEGRKFPSFSPFTVQIVTLASARTRASLIASRGLFWTFSPAGSHQQCQQREFHHTALYRHPLPDGS